jgi:hypothetical protein
VNHLYYGPFQVLVFFLLTLCGQSAAPPGYTRVYSNNFYGPTTSANNTIWTGGYVSSLNFAGQGFSQGLGYWEVALSTNNWGYWPEVWLSGSLNKQRTTNSAELGVVEAGAMTGIGQHVKVLTPKGQELVSLLHTRPGGVTARIHVFGCLIKADFITFSIDNSVIWTVPTPPEATQPLFALCNFVAAKTPPDPGAITAATISCYAPPFSLTSPSVTR